MRGPVKITCESFNENNIKNDDDQTIETNDHLKYFKYWQGNTVLLYNIVMFYTCACPPIFVHWLSEITKNDKYSYKQDLLLGTRLDGKKDAITVIEVKLPRENLTAPDVYDDEIEKFRCSAENNSRNNFRVKCELTYECEINKVCCHTDDSNIIACFTVDGDINILNLKKYITDDSDDCQKKKVQFDFALKGHSKKGNSLTWNEEKNLISSSANDSNLCIWDMHLSDGCRVVNPIVTFFNNGQNLNDCTWKGSNVLAVSQAGYIHIYDVRSKREEVKQKVTSNVLNCIAMNPHDINLFATSGNYKEISLWDVRQINVPVHKIETEKRNTTKLMWDKFQSGVLISSNSYNKYISLYDMNKVGMEQTYEDSLDGPPELFFVHGGHSTNILDFSLNQTYSPMVVASVSQDGVLNVWQPARQVYDDATNSCDDSDVESTDM